MDVIAINKFIHKWSRNEIEDHGGTTSPDYEKFQTEYKKVLQSIAKSAGMILHKFNKNHYCFSAVLRNVESDKFYYVSISDVRHFPSDWYNRILYRTMAHEKDWTGGQNNYASLTSLGSCLRTMRENRVA